MASLKDIRKRISSVKNTQKITRAMKMVAASKLRRSQQSLMAARPYAENMAKLVNQLAAKQSGEAGHPLLATRDEIKTVRLVALTSDRGFCGGFNGTLLRRLTEWLDENSAQYEKIEVQMIGKKGKDFFQARGREIDHLETGIYEGFNLGAARERSEQLIADYADGVWDECYFVYNKFKSAISQDVTFQKVVPLSAKVVGDADIEVAADENQEYIPEYIYEPEAPELLGELLPRFLTTEIYRIFLESIASEFGSRMVAMDGATNNCSDMIDDLSVLANRLRQAAITNDLMDIVNGAEALK